MSPSGRPRAVDRILRVVRVVPLVVVGAGLGAACGTGSGGRATPPLPERRVALARLVVENRTTHDLAIAFRYTTEPRREVVVGRVAAGGVAEMAPVPAEEPIVLVARGGGFVRRLEPRSLPIDRVWRWVIREDEEPGTEPGDGAWGNGAGDGSRDGSS